MFSKNFKENTLSPTRVSRTQKRRVLDSARQSHCHGWNGYSISSYGDFHGNLNRTEASARYGVHYHLDSPVSIFVVHNSSSAVPGHLRTGIERGENDPS